MARLRRGICRSGFSRELFSQKPRNPASRVDRECKKPLAIARAESVVDRQSSRLKPLLQERQAAAACATRGPSSSARLTMATSRSTSSLPMPNTGVKRSEFSPPWITPRPRSRSHSSVEPAP
jgi:hypothetical protein